jgi:hypothetical protein
LREARTDCNFFERAYFQRTGGFVELLFEYARAGEDQEFYLRMRLRGLQAWLATGLFVFHDDDAPGGCEMRTVSYWSTREKCAKARAFRYRIHGGRQGKLGLREMYHLARSSFLNSGVLKRPPQDSIREISLLWEGIISSRDFLKPHLEKYHDIRQTTHFALSAKSTGQRTPA